MNPKNPIGVRSEAPIASRRPRKRRGKHPVAARAEAGGEQHRGEGCVPPQPVVRVELVERIDGLPLALVRGIRHRGLEHPDERERHRCEQCAAVGDHAVTRALAPGLQATPQAGPEEDQQECDQRRAEEGDELVLTPVRLPVVEGRGDVALAGRIVAEEDERGERTRGRPASLQSAGSDRSGRIPRRSFPLG